MVLTILADTLRPGAEFLVRQLSEHSCRPYGGYLEAS